MKQTEKYAANKRFITTLLRWYRLPASLCLLFSLIASHVFAVPSGQSLIVLPSETTIETPVLNNTVRLLRRNLPQPVDVLHKNDYDEKLNLNYSTIVYAGRVDQLGENLIAKANIPQLEGDAHYCRTISRKPLAVCLTAGNDRGVLYAASELCRAIRLGMDLHELDIIRKPLAPVRMALMGASTHFGTYFRPGMYDESVEKLAHLGANSLLVVPARTHGTSAGMEELPFRFRDGQIVPIEPRLKEWQRVFNEIESYGHDIYVLCPAWIPPDLDMEHVRDYYDGKIDIPGYEAKAAQTMKQMLAAIFEHLPQIDGIVLHSLELGELWGPAVSIFPTQDLERARSVTETYLNAVIESCQAYDKIPCFWSHVFGVDGQQLRQLRSILAAYPDIVNIEDSYWNNTGWPFLPIMGYLPDDLRKTIHLQNRFALFSTTTDGEYYSGGKLPVAYPDPFYEAAQEGVNLKAEMMIVRLNEHDETNFGTLGNINAIHVEASLRALWTPTPDLEEIWDEWSRLRYAKAGAAVEPALKRSQDVLLKGLTFQGLNLMSHESIIPGSWAPGGSIYKLFSKPGTPILQKEYKDLQGVEFLIWQSDPGSVPVEIFRSVQEEALQAAAEGERIIEKEQRNLTEEDYAYFMDIYDNAAYILKAIRLLGEVAYATNLVADNYDHHPDPAGLVRNNIGQLEAHTQTILREKGNDYFRTHYFIKARWKDKVIEAPSLVESLSILADMYRSRLEEFAQ